MICFRCGKDLGHANDTNSDYIMAEDTKSDDLVTIFIVLMPTPETIAKKEKGEPIDKSEYKAIEINQLSEAVGAVKITAEQKLKRVQKANLVCPNCYKKTDYIIWGIHKESV